MSPPYPYFAVAEHVASAPLVLPHTGRLQSEPTGATLLSVNSPPLGEFTQVMMRSLSDMGVAVK